MNLNTANNKHYNICLSLDIDKIGTGDAFILKVMDNKKGGYILEIYAGTHANAAKEFDNLCEVYYKPYRSKEAFKKYLEQIAKDMFDYTTLTDNDIEERMGETIKGLKLIIKKRNFTLQELEAYIQDIFDEENSYVRVWDEIYGIEN